MDIFKHKDPSQRIGAIHVLKHLINRLADELEDRKEYIVSGANVLKFEENLGVRKAFAQLIIAMAHREYLQKEGGQSLVEFVVRNCSISQKEIEAGRSSASKGKSSAGGEVTTPGQLRDMCDHVLYLITTTIASMENVLYPYLLETVVPVEYTDALAIVCKCIAFLGAQKRDNEADDYLIDFDQNRNSHTHFPPHLASSSSHPFSSPSASPSKSAKTTPIDGENVCHVGTT
eukprot:TRINITY_DN689_c0_g1_i5.p1 TRINITY_DN689_c0_g1~~TRINITY_DN689_c0_g1_i5.p1  ORF type:complete len:231 (-),score=63.29 TRINITY_DN689_c0_g1_i5:380-1072(-)